jgi:large subunit ribosomal protein L35Ae
LQISRRPAPRALDEHVADPPPPFGPSISSARTNQTNHTSLIKLENVNDKASADFYLGKKLCYVYKAKTKKKGTVFRTSWGKVTRAHGSSGVVRAKFKKNLPPSSMGGKIRCMLYPSSI